MRSFLLVSLCLTATAVFADDIGSAASKGADPASELISQCAQGLTAISQDPPQLLQQNAAGSGKALVEYFEHIGEHIVERDYVSTGLQRALIGRQPILLVGPPGNAKTRMIKYALGHILDKNGQPSFFTDQMTFETTLSDTHGNLNFKELMDTGPRECVS